MICPYCKKEITPVEEFIPTITVLKNKDGTMKTWTEEVRDLEGSLIQRKIDDYTYEGKCIKTIQQKVYDSKEKLTADVTTEYPVDKMTAEPIDAKK
jgi:transcriptional regulator NrdR family protein